MKKRFLEKQVNKNFMLTLILVAILLLLVLRGVALEAGLSSSMNGISSEIEQMRGEDEIGDVEGYAIIAYGIGYGLGAVGWMFMVICLIIIPAVLAFFIFIFALIARLIYKETPGRILAYRIIMGFSFLGQILMLWCCFSGLIIGAGIGLMSLVLGICTFAIIFMGMRGTYTKRLKDGESTGSQEALQD